MSNKLVVYSKEVTPRLSYIVNLIFHELLGLHVDVTDDKSMYDSLHRAKVNYSDNQELEGFQIVPSYLLHETGIQAITPAKGTDWLNLPSLILKERESFDPLAASFYLVSRYEEYTSTEKDDHNRFPATASCLVQLGLIDRPIVNEWALALLAQMTAIYPDLKAEKRSFQYLSTIDIDQAWKYRHKGFIRNMGGLLRDISKKEWPEVKDRIAVLAGTKLDPFFNYPWQDEVHDQYDTQVQYFIQVGRRGKYDKNTSFENASFQGLIEDLDRKYDVDIHPSYQSNKEVAIVQREIQALANLLARDVHTSRQHYLIHEMPKTYRNLIDLGITQDHTLGYSTHAGFRAGIAAPFSFFDLEHNESTKLRLIPFCIMDITPLHYDQLSVDQSMEYISQLMAKVQAVGGLFVSLWHNESMSDSGRWKGWKPVYEHLIRKAHETLAINNE